MKLRQNFACQVSVNKSLQACCVCSLVFAHVFMVFIQIWSLEYSREKKFIQDLLRCRSNKNSKHVRVLVSELHLTLKRLDKDVTGGIPVV